MVLEFAGAELAASSELAASELAASDTALDAVFRALADPTRRAILAHLRTGSQTVAELAAPFAMSQPAVSKHLKVLERAGLISRNRQGTARLSRLEAAPLLDATRWLGSYREFWEVSHDRLDDLLASLGPDPTPPGAASLTATPTATPTATLKETS